MRLGAAQQPVRQPAKHDRRQPREVQSVGRPRDRTLEQRDPTVLERPATNQPDQQREERAPANVTVARRLAAPPHALRRKPRARRWCRAVGVRIARNDIGERKLPAHRDQQPGEFYRVAATLAPVHADDDVF